MKKPMKSPYMIDSTLIPWDDCPSVMTNEIAFEIGKADFPRFYDMPIWSPNVEKFKYVHFFEWSSPRQGGGRYEDGEYYCNWSFYGSLKESSFDLEQKRHYIRGVLASYAGSYSDNILSFSFANSFGTRDRIAKWIDEILKDKFGGIKTWTIEKSDGMNTCPAIANLTIKCDGIDSLLSQN